MPLYENAEKILQEMTLPENHWMRKFPDDHIAIKLRKFWDDLPEDMPREEKIAKRKVEAQKYKDEIAKLIGEADVRKTKLRAYETAKEITPKQRRDLYFQQQENELVMIGWGRDAGLPGLDYEDLAQNSEYQGVA